MASVQFNLLPDVKLEYIKTQRSKHLVMTVATVAAGAAIVIFLLVFLTVEGVQKKQLNDSSKDITAASNQLKGISNLTQILTVQNQLSTLSSLHHQDTSSSRLFGYLPQLTPVNAHIGSITVDFTANALTINGTADSQTTVNTFIDTLKLTNYKVGAQDSNHQAFTSVVESSFSITSGTVDYGLTMNFDPVLFSNDVASTPQLVVPKLSTTQSVDSSGTLFNGQTGPTTTPTTSKTGSQ